MRKKSQPLALIHKPSCLDKCKQDHGGWQKVRLMPALLRIFTRVNLLVMVGEEQGMKFFDIPFLAVPQTDVDFTRQPTVLKSTTISWASSGVVRTLSPF